jgi:glucose/arabinose dehydrogenase
VVRLANGSTLISERDSGSIIELTADGSTREVGVVPDVAASGEGGLLGLAVAPGDQATVFAYLTTASDNRIVRMPLTGTAGNLALGDATVVLDGLEKAGNHNGGRIAFGPDGMLYATVGDAGVPDRAQDTDSLNGKILRMTPDGDVPAGNPFDSLVYSYGHRNPQGITWDAAGQLYAAEFGQDTWDEFNRIEAGGNYGWPVVEGEADDDAYVDPIAQWATDDASPSGLTSIGATFFLAALKGERLWAVSAEGDSAPYFEGDFGRIRDVLPGPDGTLWLLTNNTDGRGSPTADDDRLIEVVLDD